MDCSLTVNNLCFYVIKAYACMLAQAEINSAIPYGPTFMCTAVLRGDAVVENDHEYDNVLVRSKTK